MLGTWPELQVQTWDLYGQERPGRPGLAGSRRNTAVTGRPHRSPPSLPTGPLSPAMKRHMLPTANQASPALGSAGSMETGVRRSACEELLGLPCVSLK